MTDFSDDPVTYYSDDEMVMKRKGTPFGGLRSKKGHPIYSREDIREQYCINRKELQVFEDNIYHQRGLFGCLSTSHLPDTNPCNKNLYLFSCMQKGKCSTDLEPEHEATFRNRVIDKSGYRNDEEDEDSDGGFKRRPKPRNLALLESRNCWTGRFTGNSSSHFRANERLPVSTSQPSEFNEGYKLNHKQGVQQNRPNLLDFKASKDSQPFSSSSSKSVDELNNSNSNGNSLSDSWAVRTGSSALRPSNPGASKVDYPIDQRDERTKHVSFDCSNLIRSNTVASGLETPCNPSSSSATPGNTHDHYHLQQQHVHHIHPTDLSSHRYSLSSALANTSTSSTSMDPFLNQLSPDPLNSKNTLLTPRSSYPASVSGANYRQSSQHSFTSNNLGTQSQERLITGSFRSIERCESIGNSSLFLVNQPNHLNCQPYFNPVSSLTQPNQQPTTPIGSKQSQVRSIRRVVMKTHATQTESSLPSGNHLTDSSPLPDYLTLSPRASGSKSPSKEDNCDAEPDAHWNRLPNKFIDHDNDYETNSSTFYESSKNFSCSSHQHRQQYSQPQVQYKTQRVHRAHAHSHHHHSYNHHQASNRRTRNDNVNENVNNIGKGNPSRSNSCLSSSSQVDSDDEDENVKNNEMVNLDGREAKGRDKVRSNYNMQVKEFILEERQSKVRTRVRMKVQRSLSTSIDDTELAKEVDWHSTPAPVQASASASIAKNGVQKECPSEAHSNELSTKLPLAQPCVIKSISIDQMNEHTNYHSLSNLDGSNTETNHISSLRDIGLYRRHSVAADFFTSPNGPVLYPPPGFEDGSSPTADCNESPALGSYEVRDGRSASSSSSSKAFVSGEGTDEGDHSLTEMDDDYDSPTLISDLSSALLTPSKQGLSKGKEKVKNVSSFKEKVSWDEKTGDANVHVDIEQANQLKEPVKRLSSESSVTNNSAISSPVKSEPFDNENEVQFLNETECFDFSSKPIVRKTSGSGSSIYNTANEESPREEDDEDEDEGGKENVVRRKGFDESEYQENDDEKEFIQPSLSSTEQNDSTLTIKSVSPSTKADGEVELNKTLFDSQTESKVLLTPIGLRVRRKSGSLSNKSGNDDKLIDLGSSDVELECTGWRKELVESPLSDSLISKGSSDQELDSETQGVNSETVTPIHEVFSSDPSSTGRDYATIVEVARIASMGSPTSTEVTIKSEEEEEEEENESENVQKFEDDKNRLEDEMELKTKRVNMNLEEKRKENNSNNPNETGQGSEESSIDTYEVTLTTITMGTGASSSTTTATSNSNDSTNAGEDSEGDPVESDNLDIFSSDNNSNNTNEKEAFSLTALGLFCRRTLSGELSTVSEVSEEISGLKSLELSGQSVSPTPGLKESSSSEGTLNNKEDEVCEEGEEDQKKDQIKQSDCVQKKVSLLELPDRTEVSSPSSFSDSTTSGSFLIDGQPESNLPDDQCESKTPTEETIEREIDSTKCDHFNENRKRVKLSEETSILGESVEEQIGEMVDDDDDDDDYSDKCKGYHLMEESEEVKSNNHQTGVHFDLLGDKSSGNNNVKEDEREEEERRMDNTGGESSQATEQDMARLEFSLTQQSSQEIDEESLSMGTHHNNKGVITGSQVHHAIEMNSYSHESPVPCKEFQENLNSTPNETNNNSNETNNVPSNANNNNNNNGDNIFPEASSGLQGSSLNKKLRFIESKKSASMGTSVDRSDVESSVKMSDEQQQPNNHHHHDNKLVSSRPTGVAKVCANNGKRPPLERRTRSLTRSPGKSLSPVPLCTHQFTCNHCGESASHGSPSTTTSSQPSPSQGSCSALSTSSHGTRKGATRSPHPYRKSATIEDMLSYRKDDDEDIGVYSDAYKSCPWFYIGHHDELRVWGQRRLDKQEQVDEACKGRDGLTESPQGDIESTPSEKGFKKHYEAVTHRMIHRKASIEMYKKILDNAFNVEKSVIVERLNGEFGFRIHGSRPVVVSAIERGTPAESCGLEVGDIVVSVNDMNVLDASHSEVVRLAHAGSETLKLELVRTCQKLKSALKELKDDDEIFSGYLNRKSPSLMSSNVSNESLCWKKRWFVLRPDYCLYWYNQPKTIDPLGVINLQNCTITLIPPSTVNHCENRYLLRIDKMDGPSNYLSTTVEENAQRWLQHLSSAANKVSRTNSYIEKTLRCIHIKPLAIKDFDCRGYLGIFGQKRKLWKQRYFVLKDACLYSYIDLSSSTALGVFYLHGCKVQSTSLAGKRNTFEIIPWDRKMKHLWLMAESEIDKKRWLAALEYSIDRWIKLN
ncbi:uncharacterized protein LOC107359058 [Tetranychus urticae]|uniref:uncharacterized protein LOC107359058 n=1 Tax=Tetranychus urticae TaxID=32264 RepID=UPI00077BB1FD|nr:uncharacterized protein LOC107359058 [Tetranychus urticae]